MKCSCCNSTEMVSLHIVDDSFNRPVLQCKDCTHIQLETFPNAKECELYYKTTYSESRNVTELRNMYERRAMSQLIYMSKFLNVENEIGSVCDLGCGYGVFLQKCSTYAQNVSGYELDPLCIEYCRERGLNVNIIDNYYSSSSSSSGSVFNLTIMSHFLEHIPDIDDLLMHLRLHTRYLFIEIPATNINYPFANSGHVHFFNEKSISKLLQIRGFKIIDISRWGNSWKEYCRLIYIQKLIRHFKPLYRICRHIKEKYLSYIYENSQIHFEHNRTKQISRQYRENKDGIWIRVLAEVERAYTCNFSLKSSRSSH